MSLPPTDSSATSRPEAEHPHVVKFYDDDDDLFSMVGEFLAAGASAGDPVIIIARPERHERFASMLSESTRVHLLDAHEVLAGFMSGSLPDKDRFHERVGNVIRRAREHGRVRAYGEMVDILWQDGNAEGTMQLEELWNELARQETFALFCAYPIGHFLKETDREHFDRVCSAHTHVHAAITTRDSTDETRALAVLQQRTLALETEIRQRKELEQSLLESLAARRAAETELRRLYELAEESNRTKDQFLATLSHELRTPLTAILGWARMLTLGGLDSATTRMALETIERSARMQAAIVDDLLDLSKIVTGKLSMQRELVDLDGIIDDAVQTCQLAAEAKNIEVSIVRQEERTVVIGDPTRLRQIVWNLFSNAVKYSPSGGKVSIGVDRGAHAARITVRDNGCGIDAKFLEHMFEPFRQADATSTRGQGGLGLGLTIVKHLTELHGGTVEAQSDGTGQGSTFTVTLPLVHVSGDVVPAPADSEIDLNGVRVLVVEDDEATGDLLRAVLVRFGAEVAVEMSLDAALGRVRELDPQVVVTDIALGRDDGFEVLAAIRRVCAVPVVAVTALSYPGTEERVRAAGFDASMRKPVDPVAFARRIATLVSRGDSSVN